MAPKTAKSPAAAKPKTPASGKKAAAKPKTPTSGKKSPAVKKPTPAKPVGECHASEPRV